MPGATASGSSPRRGSAWRATASRPRWRRSRAAPRWESGTVYRHFPNKEDLVEALAADRFERLAGLAEEALEREDPGPAFDDFVRASARIQSEDRALSEVLTSRPETMRRAADGVGMLDLVAEVIGRAQEAGAIRGDARPEDIPMLMCALAGTYRNPHADPERYIAIVLDGLRAPGSTPLR